MRAPRPALRARPTEWQLVRVRARLEVARLRALPETDMLAQVREGCWPNPTEEQIRQGRLYEEQGR